MKVLNSFRINIVIVEWKMRDHFVFNEVFFCNFKEAQKWIWHDQAFVA